MEHGASHVNHIHIWLPTIPECKKENLFSFSYLARHGGCRNSQFLRVNVKPAVDNLQDLQNETNLQTKPKLIHPFLMFVNQGFGV